MMIAVICLSVVVLVTLIIHSNIEHRLRKEWAEERQQLLDRIQAPSYDHLKHHEVRVIKAKQPEKEKPPDLLDPM